MARIFPDESMMMYWAGMGINGDDGDDCDDLGKRVDLRNEMFIQTEPWERPNCFHLGPKLPSGDYTGVKVLRRRHIVRYFESQVVDLVNRAKHIEHLNLVPYLGCATDYHREELQLWQQHVQSQPLSSVLKSRKRGLDDLICRSYLVFILRGIRCLHDNELAHTRLAPSKILISRDGVPVVCDYCVPTTIYKPVYLQKYSNVIAPEIHSGLGYTLYSDVWSIGLLCIQLYTGNAPLPNDYTTVSRLTLPLEEAGDAEEEEEEEGASKTVVNKKKVRELTKEEIGYHPFVPPEAMNWALQCLKMVAEERPTVDDLLETDFLNTPQVQANVQKMQRFAESKRSSRISILEDLKNIANKGDEEESEEEEETDED